MKRFGTILMALGGVMLACALVLFFVNRQADARAGARSEAVVQRLMAAVAAAQLDEDEVSEPAHDGSEPSLSDLPDTPPPVEPKPYDYNMDEVVIDGYAYIAYLTVPFLDDPLPIMSTWNEEQLKIAPCRYAGSTWTADLVIMAHNYRNHFGSLQTLSIGDELRLTDMTGRTLLYEVSAIEYLPPDAGADMVAGVYDLTLFTCTYGGQNRLTVRCDRKRY